MNDKTEELKYSIQNEDFSLGLHYIENREYIKAIEHFKHAAASGIELSFDYLATCYRENSKTKPYRSFSQNRDLSLSKRYYLKYVNSNYYKDQQRLMNDKMAKIQKDSEEILETIKINQKNLEDLIEKNKIHEKETQKHINIFSDENVIKYSHLLDSDNTLWKLKGAKKIIYDQESIEKVLIDSNYDYMILLLDDNSDEYKKKSNIRIENDYIEYLILSDKFITKKLKNCDEILVIQIWLKKEQYKKDKGNAITMICNLFNTYVSIEGNLSEEVSSFASGKDAHDTLQQLNKVSPLGDAIELERLARSCDQGTESQNLMDSCALYLYAYFNGSIKAKDRIVEMGYCPDYFPEIVKLTENNLIDSKGILHHFSLLIPEIDIEPYTLRQVIVSQFLFINSIELLGTVIYNHYCNGLENELAILLCKTVADVNLGNGVAALILGNHYFRLHQYVESLKYLEQSVEMGNSDAMVSLSAFYFRGIGNVSVDKVKSEELLIQARNLGNERAASTYNDYF